jgi:hypothetical protein
VANQELSKASLFKAAILFLPLIFYNPFFLTQLVYPPLRIGSFVCLTTYLFFGATRFTKFDATFFFALTLFGAIVVSRNSSDMTGLVTIGNYILTFVFGWGLYRYLACGRRRSEILLGLYVAFFYIVVTCSLLSILYIEALGEMDLFGLKSDIYGHLVTPFGMLFTKEIGPLTFYRTCFYFDEPTFVAIFYAANIILVAPLLKEKSRFFILLNLLGAFITMSLSFYVLVFILYSVKKIKSTFGLVAFLIGVFGALYFIQIMNSTLQLSYDDRVERINLFFTSIEAANITQLWLGHGVAVDTGFDRGFSSGFVLSIYETGLIGIALQMFMLFKLSPSFLMLIYFMLAAAIVDPIHIPLFLFLIIVLYFASKNDVFHTQNSPYTHS